MLLKETCTVMCILAHSRVTRLQQRFFSCQRVLRKTSSRAAMDSVYQKLAFAIAYQTVSMDLTNLMDAKDGAINTNSHASKLMTID